MHFRERGQGIQLFRSSVDPETSKTTETVFGSIPKRTLEIDPALMEQATPEEQAEIRAFLERYKQILAAKAQAEVYSLPEVVRTAVRYLEGLSDPNERGMLRDMMLDASRRLRRAAREDAEEAVSDPAGAGGRPGRKAVPRPRWTTAPAAAPPAGSGTAARRPGSPPRRRPAPASRPPGCPSPRAAGRSAARPRPRRGSRW
jgi:hypothetical protein